MSLLVVIFALVVLFTLNVYTLNVTHISMCPALSPRPAPTSAHDLRPDDIKVIGALGDR